MFDFSRGLTPPHRVKSITMATFTQEEINFIKDRGNEFCRAIWLGLIPQNFTNYSKNEQKMKDLMSSKYELKKFYLDPVIDTHYMSKQSSNPTTISHSDLKDQIVIDSEFSRSYVSSVPLLICMKNEDKFIYPSSTNFFADFSKVPSPTSAMITTEFSQVDQPSFAHFDDNPIFNLTAGTFYACNYTKNHIFSLVIFFFRKSIQCMFPNK